MLRHCLARLIGRDAPSIAQLQAIAGRVGFGQTRSLLEPDTVESRTLLPYFLLHRGMSRDEAGAIVAAIRRSDRLDVRFAPVVLFSDDMEFPAYRQLIKLGFDDIIIMPEKRDILVSRLNMQLRTQQVYFETATYLGPDRRRFDLPVTSDQRHPGRPNTHIRHVFTRDPVLGIQPLERRLIAA